MAGRIEALKGLLDQDPSNCRFRYMLAMETINSGDLAGAAQVFAEILAQDDTYAAAYFHGGQTLEKLGRMDEARSMYRQGIEATRRSGDSHTRSELEGALALIGG